MAKTRNGLTAFQAEKVRLEKELKQKLRGEGLNPVISETILGEKPVPLRIEESMRVNLNVNPQEYQRFLEVAKELTQYFKFDPNPTKGPFYKDCVEVCYKVLDLVRKEHTRILNDQEDLNRRRKHWKFKTNMGGGDNDV